MALDRLPFWLINAFTTDSPHSGNQAAVVLFPNEDDPRVKDDEYKQKVAKDFNFAETAFVVPQRDGRYGLRWFTPDVEVPLCGHATLAAARVVLSEKPELETAKFITRFSGELTAQRVDPTQDRNGQSTDIRITLPTFSGEALARLNDQEGITAELKGRAASILGISQDQVLRLAPFDFNGDSVVIHIDSGIDLANLSPDPKAFTAFAPGVAIVTQIDPTRSSDGRLGINSRVHASKLGIDEDPVTGSAHAYLVAYYLLTRASETIPQSIVLPRSSSSIESGATSNQALIERLRLDAKQLSPRRGNLDCRLDSADHTRVDIVGSASEMGRGTLSVW